MRGTNDGASMSLPRPSRRLALVSGALGAVALVVASACVPLGQPAIRQRAVAPRVFDASDPYVLVAGGHTYLFGSSNNMRVPVRSVASYAGSLTASQSDWARAPRDAMPTKPAWVRTEGGSWEIWAPSVIRIGDTYYLYFAGKRIGATDLRNDQCIGRASSKSPTGPFAPAGSPLYCGLTPERGSNSWGRGALDPEVFRAPDGKLYLLAALSRTGDNIGVVPLASNGLVPGGVNAPARTLVSQAYPWHDGTDDGAFNAGGAFLENPSMVYEPQTRTYLLFYSAGQWNTARYVTGFARCQSPMGPCTVDARAPFLMGGNGRTGTGGLTAYRSAAGELRVAYASWQQGRENQVGPAGAYKRQVSWSTLSVTATTDPAKQTIRLVG